MECVLGKSCAVEGTYGDATAFTSASIGDESKGTTIAEQLCERLEMNGYKGNGTEELYNGMTGMKMGEFFIGPVYYQRLKHLVSDKMHARSTGPVTTLTRQPLNFWAEVTLKGNHLVFIHIYWIRAKHLVAGTP